MAIEKGERLSFSSISVVDELPTSKVLKNFHCHYSVQGTPDCVFWNCQVERKGIRQNEREDLEHSDPSCFLEADDRL